MPAVNRIKRPSKVENKSPIIIAHIILTWWFLAEFKKWLKKQQAYCFPSTWGLNYAFDLTSFCDLLHSSWIKQVQISEGNVAAHHATSSSSTSRTILTRQKGHGATAYSHLAHFSCSWPQNFGNVAPGKDTGCLQSDRRGTPAIADGAWNPQLFNAERKREDKQRNRTEFGMLWRTQAPVQWNHPTQLVNAHSYCDEQVLKALIHATIRFHRQDTRALEYDTRAVGGAKIADQLCTTELEEQFYPFPWCLCQEPRRYRNPDPFAVTYYKGWRSKQSN